MKIEMFGPPEKEKILLLHPMFTDGSFFARAVPLLERDHCLIVPTLSGHEPGSVYRSMEQEEAALGAFLQANGITRLKAAAGFSLGGNILFHYFCRRRGLIDRVVLDSAPLFRFPRPVKRLFFGKYRRCLEEVRRDPARAAQTLDKQFHGMGAAQQGVAPLVTATSLQNLVESCYSADLPPLDAASQKKLTFVYGGRDPAALCLPRVRRYRGSRIVRLRGYGHCGYFQAHPAEYLANFLLG